MMREFDGDTLLVHIPKKQTYGAEQFKSKKTAERSSVEKPQFPANLPGETELSEKLTLLRETEQATAPASKKHGSSRAIAGTGST